MKEFETVGVVIPTFERYSETVKAVESVLYQTYPVSKVVVIDDGSSPETVNSLSKSFKSFPQVKFIASTRSFHPAIKRNIGIESLNTEWIAFLDSDDQWLPEKLEKQIAFARERKVDAVCSNVFLKDPKGEMVDQLFGFRDRKITTSQLLNRNLIVNSTAIVRLNLIKEIGGLPQSYSIRGCEDFAAWLRISTRSKWGYISEPLCVYSLNSPLSVRFDEGFTQNFAHEIAILDFLNWQQNHGLSNLVLTKNGLKVISRASFIQNRIRSIYNH